jgi:hypothetical protein
MNHEHNPDDWRLFIDSSKSSLKAVLLCNKQVFPSVPMYFSREGKEDRETAMSLLNKINYHKHRWLFCGDLKIIGIICGIQSQGANHPCFICDWKKPPSRMKKDAVNSGFEATWPEYKGTA